MKLPSEVSRLAGRMMTHGAAHNENEPHCLRTLCARLMLSKPEVIAHIAAGRLLPVSGPENNRFLFKSAHLDALRNAVVGFIAESICVELARRGHDQESMVLACTRAFERQTALARARLEDVVEFDRDDDHTARNAAVLAGGAAAGYLGYRYLKGRKRNGAPLLPGSGGDGTSDGSLMPSPIRPSGSGGATALPSTAASDAMDHGLLGAAIQRGRKAVGAIGGAIRSALRMP